MIKYLKINYFLYTFTLFTFLYACNFAMPIETIPDEVAQLKNIYAMINSKSFSLQYNSFYSVWTHYFYIFPTLIYWAIFYIFSNLNSTEELKFYILNNYQDVLPFLRAYTAVVFFIGLILIKRVIEDSLSKIYSYIFYIFVTLNLLVIINVHYSKHWMADFGLIFMALYFYWKYKKSKEIKFAFIGYFLFTFASLSSYPLILMGIYFIFLHYKFDNSHKNLLKDFVVFIILFLLMFGLTSLLGSGNMGSTIVANPSRFLIIDMEIAKKLIFTEFEYDPFVFIFFISSIIYLIITKHKKILFALIPYGFNLYLMSTFHFEPRYAIFMVLDGAFIATFFAVFLYKNYKKLTILIFVVYIFYNLTLLLSWLNLASSNDTRLEARSWINNNVSSKNFIIYNTWGFNYLPLTKEAVKVIKELVPNSISTREEFHLKYNLLDGKNGILLWKVVQANYDINKFITQLQKKGYNILFINEEFGSANKMNRFSQPASKVYNQVLNSFNYEVLEVISPYKNNRTDIDQKIGDVLMNFNYPFYTLYHLKKTGPLIKIIKVEDLIHN